MATTDISGTTQISDEGIKKHFKGIESWHPIFELIWNGLDARAKTVQVVLFENELAAIDQISVFDDGDGIDPATLRDTFGKFNDSNKKEDAAQHGAHGRGRLAFHRICDRAVWHTKCQAGGARIEVAAGNIKDYKAHTVETNLCHLSLIGKATGTVVELDRLTESLPTAVDLQAKFSTEFGWFLALRPEVSITLNGIKIEVPSHEIVEEEIEASSHAFKAQIIRWDEKPSSEKSYTYLLGSDGKVIYKQLSTFNHKPGFFTSSYVTSAWGDDFARERDLLTPEAHCPASPEWKKVLRQLGDATQRLYDDFLRKRANSEVEKYWAAGLFPTYSGMADDEKAWRLSNVKGLVRCIFIADPAIFNSSGTKQKKIIIRLLDKLSVSNENESLLEVLNGVLEMDSASLDMLANQLKRTTLENIVSTIETLQRRQDAAQRLRVLMNDHHMKVSETPDLQKIIEANTWLFGHRYETIGAEEDNFTKIAKELRSKVPQIDLIEEADFDGEDVPQIEGALRQTDLFLARKIPTFNSQGKLIYRCIVIEIKRPSIALNAKHLNQLDGYAAILMRHPEFSSEHMHFELVLIGRKISATDFEIRSRLNNQLARGEMGLVSEDARMKRYVLNWYTLLDGFDLSNLYMLEKLKLKRLELEDATAAELVTNLQEVTV